MKEDFFFTRNLKVPVNVPVISFKKLWSEPKIHKYKETIKGKKVVSVNGPWWVYYYYRNPVTGKMDKFIEKRGINRAKTLSLRITAASNLRKAVKRSLQEGHNPFKYISTNNNTKEKNISVEIALDKAFENKSLYWNESTKSSSKAHFGVFKRWLNAQDLLQLNIKELEKWHIVNFLNFLLKEKNVSITTQNNYRSTISGLFSELATNLDYIDHNYIENIPKKNTQPIKNKPFSAKELKDIKDYLIINDQNLYRFIQFLYYAFLRPIEITRLKIEDINSKEKLIRVQTKTKGKDYIFIIDPLLEIINNMNLDSHQKNENVFTKENSPGIWNTKKEKSKTELFSTKFKKVKDHFKFGEEYGLYSLRHNAALSVYNYFIKNGDSETESIRKLQKIMRHTNEQTTRKYLRDIGAMLPKDWSESYTFFM